MVKKNIYLVSFLVLLILNIQASLNVPITVKEPSGFDADNYPITAMVPLPYGAYYDAKSFRLVDSSNNEIPAQFNPIMHNILRDKSLRFVQVLFMADLPASSSTTFSLLDDAPAANISNPISVLETNDNVTINTGKIEIKLKKNSFNLFDEVKLISSGTSLISTTNNQGPIFKDVNSVSSYFSGRTINKFTIEESGPIRTIIRVESFTKSVSADNQEIGFISRIYAYRNSDLVKVDMALVNGENETWGYPIYFYDFSIEFPLNLTSPTIKFGTAEGVYSTNSTNGKKLVQWDTHLSRISESNGTILKEDSIGSRGWMNVADNNAGVYTSIRNFWQTYPNGLEFDATGKIKASLWPEGKHDHVYRYNYVWYVDSSDLYWIDDMVGNRKELVYKFHDGSMTENEMTALDRNFQWNPVASVPYDWHKTCAVQDFDGVLPSTIKGIVKDYDTVNYIDVNHYADKNPYIKSTTGSKIQTYTFGWNNYYGHYDRRAYTCGTGSWPYSYNKFIINGETSHYFENEMFAMSDINLRRVRVQDWDYDTYHSTSSLAVIAYCQETWRSNAWGAGNSTVKPYLDSTRNISWSARDYAHLWAYHIEEYYNVSGDPWVKDLMNFWVEFFKSTGYDHIQGATEGESTLRESTRGVGHSFGHFLMSMRITDNPNYLEDAKVWIDKIANVQKSLKHGAFDATKVGAFQIQFLDRSLVTFMQMIKEYDIEYWQKTFGIIYGTVEMNTNYLDYSYYWHPDSGTTLIHDTVGGTGSSFLDISAWFEKECGNYANRMSLEKAWALGSNPIIQEVEWDGSWHGRHLIDYYERYYNQTNRDTVPPVKINSVIASATSTGAKFEFSVPSNDVAKYHIRWDYTPIKEGPDHNINLADTVLWWMAKVGGVISTDKAITETETLNMYLPLNMDTLIYVSIKSFDSVNNMSIMSDNVELRVNVTANVAELVKEEEVLVSISPNPFNPTTLIEVSGLQKMSMLKIFDVSGAMVFTKAIQNNKIEWNASKLSSGIYMVQIISGNKVYNKRAVLIK